MKSESANLSEVTLLEATKRDVDWVKRNHSEFPFRFFWGVDMTNLVVKKDGRIVGLARVGIYGDKATIHEFAIRYGSTGKGIGKKAVELVDHELARRGVTRSEVRSTDGSMDFWKRTKYKLRKGYNFVRNPSKRKQKRGVTAPQNALGKDAYVKRRGRK